MMRKSTPNRSVNHWTLTVFVLLLSQFSYAQLVDSFDDGDFTNNPTWEGNSENFTLVSGELQLDDTDPVLTQSVLTTPLNLSNLDDIEWRFDVSQSFAGSDNNHSRIYLTSSQSTLNYSLNNTANTQGYYLKLGEAGSLDVIKLYLDNGSTTTLLASGVTPIIASFDLGIRVTRSAAGLWSVFADATGGTDYVLECSASESSFTTANYFGIICTYTSSNADNFLFDNFYIGEEQVDEEAPVIDSVVAIDSNTLEVHFSESIDPSSIANANQFTISGSINPNSVQPDDSDPSVVLLNFAADFIANTTLTLTIEGFSDLNSNTTISDSENFIWIIVTPSQYRDIVFNEVLADPTPLVGMADAEFVELHNRTALPINLEGWVLTNSNTDKVLTSYILAANDYVVLCNTTAISNFTNPLGIPSFAALTNSGDSLTLKDPNGNIIDVLEYSIGWYETASKADGGWSLEQINPEYPCGNNIGNWAESVADIGGTPGGPNSVLTTTPDTTAPAILSISTIGTSTIVLTFSEVADTSNWSMVNIPMSPFNQILNTYWSSDATQLFCITQSTLDPQTEYSFGLNTVSDCNGNSLFGATISILLGTPAEAGDLRINEIYADPDALSPLPQDEWIEISNTTATYIQLQSIELNGQILNSPPIAPFSHVLVTDDSSVESFIDYTGRVIYLLSFPALTNSGMGLELTNADGELIDQVIYDISWYNDLEKDDGGWSLELINPTLPCSGADNWTASISANQGTPGQVNSLYNNNPDTQSPTIVSVTPIDATHFSINFSEIMNAGSWTGAGFDIIPFNSVVSGTWNAFTTALICETSLPLNNSANYSFSLLGLLDCSGNALSDLPFTFVLGTTPTSGTLIITELMCDPTPSQGLPDAEYVELLNTSDLQLNLFGLYINGGQVTNSYILSPGEMVMVTDISNELAFLFYETEKLFVANFDDLTNAGGTIEILNQSENSIYELEYSSDWYHDNTKDDGGWSLEMINPNDPCSNEDNWSASNATSGGTPGFANSILDLTPDTSSPDLNFVYVPSASQLILDFNEPIDGASLSTATISINGGASSPFLAQLSTSDITQVIVTTSQMVEGIVYNFVITGLTDCWGNEASIVSGRYALAELAEPTDIVVNEILYAPNDDGSKFIELYNNSSKPINLGYWQLNDLSGGEVSSPNVLTTESILLFPYEYLVLTEDTRGVTNFYPNAAVQRIFVIEDLPDYTSEDMVILLMPDGTICDQVPYNADYHYPLLDATNGVSLERIDPSRPSDDQTNWHSASSSVQYATPGYLNSQAFIAGTSTSTLTIEPSTFSPDNDGYQDQVQLIYLLESEGFTANIQIYDLDGRLVRHLMRSELLGREGTISWDGLGDDRQKAPIGIYIIYFEAFDTSGQIQKHKTTCVLAHPLQ